jgi:glycosyltransferase involved in cell wall biosynthesis
MRILLLSDVPPCTNYTAGMVLEQLCSFLPAKSWACYSPVARGVVPDVPSSMADVPMKTSLRPRESWPVLPGILKNAVSVIMEPVTAHTAVRKIAEEAIAFGREFGADRVWCTLEGQTLIRLALPVARALKVPLYTQVWDPPGWWLRANRVDAANTRAILRRFERTLRESACGAVVSSAMAEEYRRVFGVRTIIVMPGLPSDFAKPPMESPSHSEELVLGLAGQVYASREWDALMTALRIVDWRVAGRPVRIVILGRRVSLSAEAPTRIEYLGWRSQSETIDILSQLDALYCPYWFDPAFETEARLSFPSKLASYLAAGRPVFFHGPEYASPARFLKENDAAFFCHSLEPGEIIERLADVVRDPAVYAAVTRNGRRAFDRYLTTASMRDQFYKFLGLDDSLS